MGSFLIVTLSHKDEFSSSSASCRFANETAFLFALYVLVKLYQLGPCFTMYCTSHSKDIILLFLILCLKGIETVLGNFIGISFSRTCILPMRYLLCHKSNSCVMSVPGQFHYLLFYSFANVLLKDIFLVDCNSGQ